MRPQQMKVAVIGCGGISEIYLINLTTLFSIVQVVGCSDLIPERSAQRAEQFGIRQMRNEEIWDDNEIQLVVNLTYPDSHYEVTKASLLAGKHVYCEKMMATRFEEGLELATLAQERGLMYCVAPDTFLGGGLQTVRRIVDDGWIGTPLYAEAVIVRGYQHVWEGPDPYPCFIHTPGGGIPYDMGGYYLHALINTLGDIQSVSGLSKTFFADNRYQNPQHEHYGEALALPTPTAFTGSLLFSCGAYGTLTAIADGFGDTSRLIFYGTEGILHAHDPNFFGETITLSRKGENQAFEMPFTHGYVHGDYRGLAICDMAWALRNQRKPRASCELGLHALEVIHGVRQACDSGTAYAMTTRCARPAALRSGIVGAASAMEAVFDE